jgi:site-specific DNA-cytosine methylase
MSCDLLPTDVPGPHYCGDVRDILDDKWDMMIAFPPCTHLSASGARWWKDKVVEQAWALDFVRLLLDAPIEKIALENPVGKISSAIRKPDQIIQPWQFGHGETKATCLWLKNLPLLAPTNIVEGREARVHRMPPSADRWKLRSTTYQGIADAMAAQWS